VLYTPLAGAIERNFVINRLHILPAGDALAYIWFTRLIEAMRWDSVGHAVMYATT